MHAWTLRTLSFDDIIRARVILSTVTLPLIDLTLQVEFKALDTLTSVWSRSQTKKPCILTEHLLCINYQNYQVYVGKVDSFTPIPKLKSVLKTFCKAHSIRKCFPFGSRRPGALVQAREASW